MPGTRSSAAGHFELQLDGVPCGFLKAFDGGDISADVISEPTGPAAFVKKHVGQPKYEDFELQLGFDLAKPFYDWISAAWNLKPQRKSGAIVATDVNQAPVSERQFVERTDHRDDVSRPRRVVQGARVPHGEALAGVRAQRQADRNDRQGPGSEAEAVSLLELPGRDRRSRLHEGEQGRCVHRQADTLGRRHRRVRIPSKEPAALEFPNLKITLAEAGAKTWDAWFEDFVIKGNNGDDEREERRARVPGARPQGAAGADHAAQRRHLRAAPPPAGLERRRDRSV